MISSDLLSSLWQQDVEEGVGDAGPWRHTTDLDKHQEANKQKRNEGELERGEGTPRVTYDLIHLCTCVSAVLVMKVLFVSGYLHFFLYRSLLTHALFYPVLVVLPPHAQGRKARPQPHSCGGPARSKEVFQQDEQKEAKPTTWGLQPWYTFLSFCRTCISFTWSSS